MEKKLTLLERLNKVLFDEAILEDGETQVVADEFAPGEEIKVVVKDEETGEEELVDAPIGEHKTEDGVVVVVEEEGVIAEVKEVEEEEVVVEEEMEEDEIDYALQIAALMDRVAKLEDALMKSAEVLKSHKEEFAAFKKLPAAKLITEELKLAAQETEKPLTRAEMRLMQLKTLTNK